MGRSERRLRSSRGGRQFGLAAVRARQIKMDDPPGNNRLAHVEILRQKDRRARRASKTFRRSKKKRGRPGMWNTLWTVHNKRFAEVGRGNERGARSKRFRAEDMAVYQLGVADCVAGTWRGRLLGSSARIFARGAERFERRVEARPRASDTKQRGAPVGRDCATGCSQDGMRSSGLARAGRDCIPSEM